MRFRPPWTEVRPTCGKALKLGPSGAEEIHVAPFHPLRYETRVLVARALTACALFCAIAVVLLAGSGGQIATAEAKKDKGAADGAGVVVVQDEPVAQAEPV